MAGVHSFFGSVSLRFLIPVLILLGAGLITISSISAKLFALQSIWAVLGLVVFFILSRIDMRVLFNYNWFVWGVYLLAVILLVFVYLEAPLIRNTRSWIVVGPFNFQPVEFAKIALMLVYANYFSRRHLSIAHIRNVAISFLIFSVPALLTLMQPDLGSTTVLFAIWFGFLLASGLPLKRIVVSFLIFALLGVLAWSYFLKDYQKARILGFLYPEKDPLGVNYSVIQSKIAIGSAGLWGKGYGQGSQVQLGFLTEPATDFILAAFIEEWGIIAGLFLIVVFAFLIFEIFKTAFKADMNLEKFICVGAILIFSVQFFLNAGSTTGLLPVVGVTFPFFSYGGSSLLTSLVILAIVNSIAKRLAL